MWCISYEISIHHLDFIRAALHSSHLRRCRMYQKWTSPRSAWRCKHLEPALLPVQRLFLLFGTGGNCWDAKWRLHSSNSGWKPIDLCKMLADIYSNPNPWHWDVPCHVCTFVMFVSFDHLFGPFLPAFFLAGFAPFLALRITKSIGRARDPSPQWGTPVDVTRWPSDLLDGCWALKEWSPFGVVDGTCRCKVWNFVFLLKMFCPPKSPYKQNQDGHVQKLMRLWG